MNLSLGAAIALLLVVLQEASTTDLGIADLFRSRAGAAARRSAVLASIIVVSAISVVVSFSRGGIISMVIAALAAAIILTSARKAGNFGWVLGGIGMVVLCLVLYFGFDTIANHFLAASDREHFGGRAQILRDLVTLWKKFPLLGTGLGTHEMIFPMVDTSTAGQAATYAENDYAQLMEEMGAVGVAILLAFVGTIAVSFVACLRRHRAIHLAAIGLGFGLVAVMVHSLSDFGQHIPANAMLAATFCGLIAALPRFARGHREQSKETLQEIIPIPSIFMQWTGAIAVLAVVIALCLTLRPAEAARRAERHSRQAGQIAAALEHTNWDGSNDQFEDLINQAWLASNLQPDDILLRYRLNEYRWRALGRLHDAQTNQYILTPEAAAFARQIVNELNDARLLCPTFGSVLSLAGQIELFVLKEPAGAEHIRAGYRLSPQDANACFCAGQLEASEQHWNESLVALRRAVALDNKMLDAAIGLYLQTPARPDLALSLAEDNSDALLQLAAALDHQGIAPDIAATARQQAAKLMQQTTQDIDTSPGELVRLAELCQQQKQTDQAIAYYRQAVAADYSQAAWHLRLAQLLAAKGDAAGASREARACLQIHPGDDAANKLLATLPIDADPAVADPQYK